MFQIIFYVPEQEKEKVKEAMFAAGAGKIGNYSRCSWEVLGRGQFLPLEGSNPHIGSVKRLEHVQEYRVEMVCEDCVIAKVVQALLQNHPYEEPAYVVFSLLAKNDF